MKRIFSYTITAQDSDQRIYDFLCHHGYSRHIRTWLKQHPGSVRLNGREALFYFPLKTGDLLEITLEEEQPSENIIPVCLPLHIIYEDEDLMVIDKPADMPVHPSIGNYENTLANAVAWYFQQQNIPFVFRCINRLDRDTTGLLILAKNMLSGAILSDQMKKREIHRIYLAITEGKTDPAGTINRPIGRADQSLILRQVDPDKGDPACTHYLQKCWHPKTFYPATLSVPQDGLSLVQLQLETGRTHQIRVHMTSIGHPLIGDTLYNPETALLARQALHSYRLAFTTLSPEFPWSLLHPSLQIWQNFSRNIMRKYFYDVVVRRYKKDLRNAFSHFSDLFIFHMIFLFIRQNFPVFLHCANPRYLCHMQIFADTFYQQIMLGYMIQTGDCNRSDHTHFFYTNRESASTGRILFLIKKSVCQAFSPLPQIHIHPQTAFFGKPHRVLFSCQPLFMIQISTIHTILEYGIAVV